MMCPTHFTHPSVNAMAGVSDSDLRAAFDAVAADALSSDISLSNDEKLELYGLFKQAVEGDITSSCPGLFDPRGRAKWNAWKGRSGMSSRDAMIGYIQAAKRMKLI